MEAEAFLLGIWKDFEEMEMTLTMEELEQILEAKSRQDMRHWKFQASLKGIPTDDWGDEPSSSSSTNADDSIIQTVEDRKKWLAAQARGVDKETFEFGELGILVERE